ncbi:MAG TPA: glycosyltransferase [Thermoanaerobaculia bacterium]|nr:glycosyltransferase [Thermoanaerobaculia bacterium]
MKPLSIAILGTRGVPPRYGGFETFAAELGTRLVARGHRVTVYCRSYLYPEKPPSWEGIDLVHLPAIEQKYLETVSHALLSAMHLMFIGGPNVPQAVGAACGRPDPHPFRDLDSGRPQGAPTRHTPTARGDQRSTINDQRRPDVVLLCNAANAFVVPLLRAARVPVATNVDGIERKRKKWNALGKLVYLTGEALAAHFSTRVIADASTIAAYYRDAFDVEAETIAYGSDFPDEPDSDVLARLGIQAGRYVLYVSRFEPENHPVEVAEAFRGVKTELPLVLVGSAPYSSALIERLREVAVEDERILLPGALYGADYRTLQRNAWLYVQATEVGGTHPALIEAMGSNGAVLALDTPENREVGGDAVRYFWFDSLPRVLDAALASDDTEIRARARARVRERYSWEGVVDAYEALYRQMAGRA